MRPRTSAAVMAAGLTLMGGGTAAAATGAADSGVASAAQYQPENTGTVPVTPPTSTTPSETPPATTTPSETPPTTTANAPSESPASTTPTETPSRTTHAVPSESTPPTTPPVAATTAQAPVAETSASSLPFTGYDIVPVAIGGLALLAMAGLLYRRGRRDQG